MEFSQAALQEAVARRRLIDRFDGWIFDTIEPFVGNRVLEIGCGNGNLTSHLASRELVVGVDLSENSVRTVRERFADAPNVQARVADAADPAILDLKPHRFDTVISLNVLEHIEDDVAALRYVRELLTPGGRVILIIPAHQQLDGTMDSSIGHYRRYNLTQTAEKFRQAGLRVVRQRYMNPIGAFGWFVNGRVFHRQVAPTGQLKLFNKLVPLITAVDGALAWPFGLSVLAIGESLASPV